MSARLELKIPPLAVVAVVALCMWFAAKVLPALTYRIAGRWWLASLALAIAIGILIAGVLEFVKAKTTVNPHKPDTATFVVTRGIYRLTRNPMYLGMLLLLLSWAIVLSNVAAALFLPLFTLFINRYQIRPEEAALIAKFGSQYSAYARAVRRWI